VVHKNRNFENYKGEYKNCVPEKYFHIHHNIMVVQNKSSKDVVLVVRCLSFANMSIDEFAKYQKVNHMLMKMSKSIREVNTNAAQRSGTMYGLGWRGGIFLFQIMF